MDTAALISSRGLGDAEIYQLAGYLPLDYDDQYGHKPGRLYLARQGRAKGTGAAATMPKPTRAMTR